MPDYGSYLNPASGVTTTRTGLLFSKIQFILGTIDRTNLGKVIKLLPNDLIYKMLDAGQHRLASDLLCLEKTTTSLSVSSGVATKPDGFFRGKLLVAPSGEWLQLEEVSVEGYDLLTRNVIGTAEQTPLYYKQWGSSITLWPTPTNGTYTMHYYGLPTTVISASVEPETPAYMDDCLLFWAVRELAPIAGRIDLLTPYTTQYRDERDRVMQMWRRTKTTQLTISHDVYV